MKKRITALALIILLTITCSSFTASAKAELEEVKPFIEYIEIEVDKSFKVSIIEEFVDDNLLNYTLDELQNLIDEAKNIQNTAHSLAESARSLGWPEDSSTIESAKAEWWNAQIAIEVYSNRYEQLFQEIEEAKWEARRKQYPAATEIWLYMKGLGWNDYVCAGIMGNLMTEVGGQTLDIQYWLYGSKYYGMCQWSKSYSEIWGAGLLDQCNFLRDTIKYELDTFGYLYAKGFNLNAFLSLTNEKEAALAFAKCYERCNSSGYAIRQKNATKVYNYFVNN